MLSLPLFLSLSVACHTSCLWSHYCNYLILWSDSVVEEAWECPSVTPRVWLRVSFLFSVHSLKGAVFYHSVSILYFCWSFLCLVYLQTLHFILNSRIEIKFYIMASLTDFIQISFLLFCDFILPWFLILILTLEFLLKALCFRERLPEKGKWVSSLFQCDGDYTLSCS